jgi:hypothetical protein
MQRFDYHSDTGSFDTLTITLACNDSAQTVPNPVWAASCIVRGPGMPDSVFVLPINTAGKSSVKITGWHSRSEALVIPTNGDPVSPGYATVSFTASALLLPSVPALALPANGTAGLGTSLTLSWNSVLVAPSYSVQVAANSSFTNLDVNRTGIPAISSAITGVGLNHVYYWRVNATNTSGTGPWSTVWSFSTFVPLTIFPNPPHLSGSNNFIRFEGSGIQSVLIYSLDGNLVTNSGTSRSSAFAKLTNGLQWELKNSRGMSVAPGYYRAVVAQRDTFAGVSSTTVHKLLVFP